MLSTLPTECCCTDVRFIAYPCWESRTRQFDLSGTGAAVAFTASGSNPNSTTPPVGTVARMVLIGAGGAGNNVAAGGGGAYLETTVTLPATSNMRIGRGGVKTDVGATVFGGGARGALGAASGSLRYGGGASGFDSTADYIAGGGGGAASANFTAQTTLSASGGNAGVSSSAAPSIDPSSAGGATNTAGGAGGLTGGAAGTLGTLPSAGSGGAGASLSVTGGGGGGGGGRAAGGGGGNQTLASVVHGGAGSGGASTNGNPALTHSAKNTYAQASPYTNTNSTRGIGDGSPIAGGNGRGIVSWRGCTNCPCPEMPATAVPPALHICLTQEQFNALRSQAEATGLECVLAPYIGFEYQGFPFYISAVPSPVDARPCDRVVLAGDITGGRFVPSTGYCCLIWVANRVVSGCTPACDAGCPATIYFCDKYRAEDLGLSVCDIMSSDCVIVSYNGCDYQVHPTTILDGDCMDPAPSPINVGTLAEIVPPPCTRVASSWQVGPHVFTGGFQCGMALNLAWDGSSTAFVSNAVTACHPSMLKHSVNFKMRCLYHWLGNEMNCSDQHIPCLCGADFDGICVADHNAETEVGLCDQTGDPSPCTSLCSCPAVSTIWTQTSNGAGIGAGCTPTYETALTITRNCNHPSGFAAIAVSGEGGWITIDGCTFTGAGTPHQFAERINSVLGDRLTATGSQNYWWGERWRGTKAYPLDFDCNTAAIGGDAALLVSNTATTAIIAAKYNSVWGLQISLSAMAHGLQYEGGFCGCCGGVCETQVGVYDSANCVIEKPHIGINAGDYGNLLLSSSTHPNFPATITLT